jgi:hypothetical protein
MRGQEAAGARRATGFFNLKGDRHLLDCNNRESVKLTITPDGVIPNPASSAR